MEEKIQVTTEFAEEFSNAPDETVFLRDRYLQLVAVRRKWDPDEIEWLRDDPGFNDQVEALVLHYGPSIRSGSHPPKRLSLTVPLPGTRTESSLPFGLGR